MLITKKEKKMGFIKQGEINSSGEEKQKNIYRGVTFKAVVQQRHKSIMPLPRTDKGKAGACPASHTLEANI